MAATTSSRLGEGSSAEAGRNPPTARKRRSEIGSQAVTGLKLTTLTTVLFGR
jgi:hypothetical protein